MGWERRREEKRKRVERGGEGRIEEEERRGAKREKRRGEEERRKRGEKEEREEQVGNRLHECGFTAEANSAREQEGVVNTLIGAKTAGAADPPPHTHTHTHT